MSQALKEPTTVTAQRQIVYSTYGQKHGPVTRLMSPSDAGELLKPFVFLDAIDMDPGLLQAFGWHPHSGIATLTVIHEGSSVFEESTGVSGVLPPGGIEWMQAGGGVWHTAGADSNSSARIRGFQLWIALPAELENAPPRSHYLTPDQVPSEGPARVILGSYGQAHSLIEAPAEINYLDVKLEKGQRWSYQPPAGHQVAWIAIQKGELNTPENVRAGELAIFEESSQAIHFEALADTSFMLGSAVKHPHDLVLGSYSVHTSKEALASGVAGIRRIGMELKEKGILR